MKQQLYLVFDVESIGLHGEGFAVGWVVINQEGFEMESSYSACPRLAAKGSIDDRKWVDSNIPEISPNCTIPEMVRADFWEVWLKWKSKGAILAADCAWPVEARFLIYCVNDSPEERNWQGPYPLIDIGSVLLASGSDPLQKFDRLPSELPEHNPLCDARQSARILIKALNKI